MSNTPADPVIARLEARAASAAKRASEAKARKQARCRHPLEALSFTEGAVESSNAAYRECEIFMRCGNCDKHFSRYVRFHRDSW